MCYGRDRFYKGVLFADTKRIKTENFKHFFVMH